MTTYRNAAAALSACAVTLSLAACSAGITSAPAATTAATASSSAGPSRSATAVASTPSAAGRTLEVGGKVGRFPVPAGAKVGENIATSGEIAIMFARVVPSTVSSFYAQALPKAGYTVTSNSSASQGGGMVLIQFSGHGYTGEVTTMAKASADETLPGLGTRNITAIILQPKK